VEERPAVDPEVFLLGGYKGVIRTYRMLFTENLLNERIALKSTVGTTSFLDRELLARRTSLFRHKN
jgi:hypothetical protein